MKEALSPSFTVREVISESMRLAQEGWQRYLVLMVISALISIPFSVVQSPGADFYEAGEILAQLVSFLINMYFAIVMARFALELVDGKQSPLRRLFTWNGKMFIAMALASLLYILIVVVGLVALIVPGIIFAIMFGSYTYVIVDKNVDAIESLKISRAYSQGNKINIFSVGVIYLLANLVALGIPALIFIIPAAPYLTEASFDAMPGGLIVGGLFLLLVMVILGVYLSVVQLAASAYMYRRMQSTRRAG